MRRFVAELIGFVALTIAVPLAAEVALRLLDIRTETPVFQPATDAGGSPVIATKGGRIPAGSQVLI